MPIGQRIIVAMTVVGTVTISRPRTRWLDRLRAYRLVVDGAVKGEIRAGEEQSFAVAPGRHWVQGRIDWTGSPRLEFEVGPGETVRLRLAPRANPLTGLWFVFGSTRWLRLTRVG